MAELAGKALYIEMRRDNYTSQVIIVPQVFNSTKGKTQKSKALTRQISSWSPRKQWSYYSFKAVPMIEKTTDTKRALQDISSMVSEMGPYFAGSVNGGWEIYKTPIVIELSNEDINDVWDAKTPNALMRRLLKARTEAGFPEELFTTA